jgi:GRAM domain-containing protein 4
MIFGLVSDIFCLCPLLLYNAMKVLLGVFFIGLLPTKLIIKLASFSVGVLFWHGIPVVLAMPRRCASSVSPLLIGFDAYVLFIRLPPPLTFVPTDAEYAMDIISQRVALGLPVRPTKSRKRNKSSASASSSSFDVFGSSSDERSHNIQDSGLDVDWDKWKGRLDNAKALPGDIKDSFKDGSVSQDLTCNVPILYLYAVEGPQYLAYQS